MSKDIQNEEELVVEDVQEEVLVENQELEQDTPEEVAEESQQTLSQSVMNVLLDEAKKKNEAEDEDEDEDEESDSEESDDDEEEEEEEMEESVEADEETIEESSEESSEEESIEESSEEVVEEETLEEGVQTKAGILADAFSTIKSMKKHDLVKAYESMQDGEIEEMKMPSTKADIINAMYKEMKGMKKDDLMAAYDAIKSTMDGEEDEEEMEEAFATDLKVLADADSNLTEDFKAKASTLFEAAVSNKVATIKEELENVYEDSLQEEIVYIRESLIEKIDNYLTYVVEDWMSENQEYVDNKLRTDIAENFMTSLKDLFVESYIEVPQSKVDLVDSLSEDVEATKAELLTISEERDSLVSQVVELQREKIISEATSDFTSTQSSKFIKLLEGIEFVDASNFESKVQVIKESFFGEEVEEESTPKLEETSSNETEIIVEGEVDAQAELSPTMQKYLSSLSRIQQNSHK